MIKKITIVFILLMCICGIVSATTASQFSLIADTKENLTLLQENLIGTAINMNYKDGYVFVIQDTDSTEKINYYDANYKVKKSVIIDNSIIIEGVSYEDYIYLLAHNAGTENNIKFKILKLNENLEIIKEFPLEGEELEEIRYYEYFDFSKYGMPFMSVANNKINIMAFDEKNEQEVIIRVDLDLTTHEVALFDDENLKTYFINYYNIGNFIAKTLQTTGIRRNYVSSDSNDNYRVYGTFNSNEDKLNNASEDDPYALTYLTLTDQNDKIIFDKTFDSSKEYVAIINVKLIDNYVVAIGLKATENNFEYKRQILVFDLEGNIVQTIDSNSVYSDLITTNNGFLVSRDDKNVDNSDVTYNNYIEFYGKNLTQGVEASGVTDNSSMNSSFKFIAYFVIVVMVVVIVVFIVMKVRKNKNK